MHKCVHVYVYIFQDRDEISTERSLDSTWLESIKITST